MALRHVVITMVSRDDLPDGGARHVADVIDAVHEAVADASVEVLTSDFAGRHASVDTVIAAGPDVFNHNLETVPRLYGDVRPDADYERSLSILARAREASASEVPTKSGLMLGLGESLAEIESVMRDLADVGVGFLTLGQYLRPSGAHLPVSRFVPPEEFEELARMAEAMGFRGVASAPYVRSSYRAGAMAAASDAGSNCGCTPSTARP